MTTTINFGPGSELEARAQSVLEEMGLDVPTAINIFLTQVVETRVFPFVLPDEIDIETVTKKRPISELRDSMNIWMADDFDAPLEEMREYME